LAIIIPYFKEISLQQNFLKLRMESDKPLKRLAINDFLS